MSHEVVYSPRASADLAAIFDWIADHADPYVARRFVGRIEQACGRLRHFPLRTTPRDDLRPGLRTTTYRRRVVIALSVEGSRVVIHGIFYGGRDYPVVAQDGHAAVVREDDESAASG